MGRTLVIPTINSCLRKEWDAFWSIGTETKVDWTPVEKDLTKELKDKQDDIDLDNLPFN